MLASKFSFVSVVLFVTTITLQLVSHSLLLIPGVTSDVASAVWPWTSALAMGAVMASQMTGRLKRCSRPYRVFLSVIATINSVLYLWPSPSEQRDVLTQLVVLVYVSLQVIGCLRILAQPQSLMADSAIAQFTPWHFLIGWTYLLWRVPATVPIVLGEALMMGLAWVSVYIHFLADDPTDTFLTPAPRSFKVAVIAGAIVGAPVFHVVSSVCHNVFFAADSQGLPSLWRMCTTPDADFSFAQVNNSLFWRWYFGMCGALFVLAAVVRKFFHKKAAARDHKKDDDAQPLSPASEKIANGALEFTARG